MKKIILIIALFIITQPFYSQYIDTANWSLQTSGFDRLYTELTNRNIYLGKAAGTVVTKLQFDINSVDTSLWAFMPYEFDGLLRHVYNRSTYYGKAAGTVVAEVVYNNQYNKSTATTSSGVATCNSLAGVVTTDNLFSASEVTVTINNSYVTTSSIIIYSIEFVDPSELASATLVSYGIVGITTGQFTIKLAKDAVTFGNEVKIHFLIIN